MTRRNSGALASRPAFYARTGDVRGDLIALLHAPYTAWHLSYVVYGAALAPELQSLRLAGVLAAFFCGTGLAAHALDEWHGRPLGTRLPGTVLGVIAAFGIAGAGTLAAAGAFLVSPWVLAWAAAGFLLMLGYTLEWHRGVHSNVGFALAWGGFPVLVSYWAQAERLDIAPLLVAFAVTLLSLAQRRLSTPARLVRRKTVRAIVVFEGAADIEDWDRARLLDTWEGPLKLLAAATIVLAFGLLAMRM